LVSGFEFDRKDRSSAIDLSSYSAITPPTESYIMNNLIASTVQLNFRTAGASLMGPVKFAIGHSVQGPVLVSRSQAGICAIFLGNDPEGLRRQLHEAFPSRPIEEAQQELRRDLDQVVAFIDKDVAEDLLSLDVGGTPFQQRVWEALCRIPAGETRTYAEVAEHVGAPLAVRAVASACAANLLAIAIPCHRVVRGDGSNSGYRWGVQRKRALLEWERA
jgi:AraC family transcriptional regulator, regulatory protein of adaptative response / methylated-DNA-[protein]-cysteine methyltransferase